MLQIGLDAPAPPPIALVQSPQPPVGIVMPQPVVLGGPDNAPPINFGAIQEDN